MRCRYIKRGQTLYRKRIKYRYQLAHSPPEWDGFIYEYLFFLLYRYSSRGAHFISTRYTCKVRMGNSSIAFGDLKSKKMSTTSKKILTINEKCLFHFRSSFQVWSICTTLCATFTWNERVNFTIGTHLPMISFYDCTYIGWIIFDDVRIMLSRQCILFQKIYNNKIKCKYKQLVLQIVNKVTNIHALLIKSKVFSFEMQNCWHFYCGSIK